MKSVKLIEPINKKSNYWLNAVQLEKSSEKLIEEIVLKLQKKKKFLLDQFGNKCTKSIIYQNILE